jgi:hypothetical protein
MMSTLGDVPETLEPRAVWIALIRSDLKIE